MGLNKLLQNAKTVNADLSAFHAPDKKWKNYYYEDEAQNLLFLIPSYLFYGIIVVDLDWARTATFQTKDGVTHMFKDHMWSMSSTKRKTSYPKTTVIDRSATCGKRTILLNSLVSGHLFQEDTPDHKDRYAADHRNGDRCDNRRINVSWGTIKENNDNRYPYDQSIPKVKYPCKVWW